ncbi:MAG: GNAT family N-acyltransferase [Bryobacteraceae bacterium]
MPVVPINLGMLLDEPWRHLLLPAEPAIQKLLLLDRLGSVFRSACRLDTGRPDYERLVCSLGVRYELDAADLERIPTTGPLIVTANHPFGFLEAAILAAILPRVRTDFKIVANSLLASVPELRDHFVFVNPYGGAEAVSGNCRPLRECLEWLRGGNSLIVFPAGDVARPDWNDQGIVDPPWSSSIARLIRKAGCQALPVYFAGANSLGFQVLSALHPRLRTASLPREMLNKRGRTIPVRIGRAVAAKVLTSMGNDRDAIEYLRFRTYLLQGRGAESDCEPTRHVVRRPQFVLPKIQLAPIAPEVPVELLVAETGVLRPLCETDEFAVYLARAAEVPNVLREIGRLRELTFRAAGEGTGRAFDLDVFDSTYLHLFLWNKQRRQVGGAYRLGPTSEILPRSGVSGLYSTTLFRFSPALFDKIGPAVELGRSFVRPEFQRQYAPLLLLWKGITRYVADHLDSPVLFGGVSISNEYNRVSRSLLIGFLENQKDPDLSPLVRPRRPYRGTRRAQSHIRAVNRFLRDVEELSAPLGDLEPDGKGVPVLIRQYMKAGGRVLGFNVDPHFSNVVDVLMMADLRRTPLPLLERYMGRPAAAAFQERSAAFAPVSTR